MTTLAIDFGTSNTAAAWLDDQQRARVAAVRDGVYLMPTVAWYGAGGHVLVGQPARQQLIDDPKNTVTGLKRFLGRRFDSPFVHQHKSRFSYEVVAGPTGTCAVKLGDAVKSLEDVAVDVLKRIVELATISHQGAFEDAIITVPAHFGFAQRTAIRRAAARAGLKVRGMVNEPTAAAMYYARKKGNDGTVLVFDLGGGTFDATLMAIMGGVVKVIATGGDAFLGGADFDAAIVDHLADKFKAERGVDLRGNAIAMQRLSVAAEAAKIELSRTEEVRIRVPCVATVDDRFLDLEARLQRKQIEALCAPLIDRAITVCEDILKRAKLQAKQVDEIVFVGGMTRMPAIRDRLSKIFVANLDKHVHPDLGVVVGAALLSGGERNLIDVNSMSIGMLLPGGVSQVLVPANTSVPSVQRATIPRPPAGQPLVFGLYEAVDATSLERDVLGTVRVPADALTGDNGPVAIEAFLGADLDLQLFVVRVDGRKIPLSLEGKDGPLPAPEGEPMRTVSHPGFRSVAIAPGDQRPPTEPGDTLPPSATSAASAAPAAAKPAAAKPAAVVARIPQEPIQHTRNKSTGAGPVDDADEPAASQPGEIVGAYLLIDLLGKGGMGRVYLAEHRLLSRRVALKMLRRRFAKNRTAIERFLTEARAVNQIHHENIIEITDYFETDDGRCCAIMEVLEGRSLAGLLMSLGTVPPDRAVPIALQVANAMTAVHDAHIIHRDLKPENIFLTQRGGRRDFVKILDFGVAKLVDQEGNSLHDTGIGARVGTLDYMPPEQLVGSKIDHRADVFALGVCMYEMITGRLPFASGGTDRELLFAQISAPRTPPSQVPGAPPVPAELDALILQCLESDAARRPQTMREVAGRLEAIAERQRLASRNREDDTTEERTFGTMFSSGLAGGGAVSPVDSSLGPTTIPPGATAAAPLTFGAPSVAAPVPAPAVRPPAAVSPVGAAPLAAPRHTPAPLPAAAHAAAAHAAAPPAAPPVAAAARPVRETEIFTRPPPTHPGAPAPAPTPAHLAAAGATQPLPIPGAAAPARSSLALRVLAVALGALLCLGAGYAIGNVTQPHAPARPAATAR